MLSILVSCSFGSDLHHLLDVANENFVNKEFDAAQSELLKADALVNDDTPLSDKEYLERLKGMNYLELRVMDKAKASLQNALAYSQQLGDTSRIIQNAFNLGLCENTVGEAIRLYENVVELAEKHSPLLVPDALEKLTQGYIANKDFDKAQHALDRACELVGDNQTVIQQIAFTQCELWQAENKLETALSGFKSIPADSCSMIGKLIRAYHIYDILYELGDYKAALNYKDSVQQFTDSIKGIDGANRIQMAEDAFNRDVEKERERFNLLLYSALAILVVIGIIFIVVLKNLRLKRKQVALTDKIAELNVKLAAQQPEEDEIGERSRDMDASALIPLIKEKFTLSLELFKTQPQYEILKKLNLIRDFDSDNRQEAKILASEIIGRFSDCCSNLREAFPSMTNDDCLLCSMSFCGCSKVAISTMLGSSEEAIRRRKSRVKQKLLEPLFSFFFN